MNFLRITWAVALLGVLAFPGCGGDDTPTPNGWEEGGMPGAGGAGNDASAVSETSTGKAGSNASDSGGDSAMCKKTAALSVSGEDLGACKAGLAEAGDDGGADCFACLCKTCPLEAKTCIGNSNCKEITDCCRAACSCPTPAPEAGPDAPASEGGGSNEASTTDSPAGDGATE